MIRSNSPSPVRLSAVLLLAASLLVGQVSFADSFINLALSGDPEPFGGTYSTQLYVLGLGEDGLAVYYPQTGLGGTPHIYRHKAGVSLGGFGRGTGTPEGGSIASIVDVDVNSRGEAAFSADTDHGVNIYAIVKGKIKVMALEGEAIGEEGIISEGGLFKLPSLNDKGQVAFHANTSGSGQAIFLVTPLTQSVTTTRIARIGDNSLDGGHFTGFGDQVAVTTPSSGSALVAFRGSTNGSVGSGLYLGTGSELHLVVPKNISAYTMNNAGQIVYEDTDIFLASIAGSVAVVRHDAPVPGGGTFTTVSQPSINDRGEIAFRGTISDATSNYRQGIFLRDAAGVIKVVALDVPGGGAFNALSAPDLNNAGLVMFTAEVRRNDQSFYGIFVGDGTDLVKIIQTGDSLLGTVIKPEGVFASSGPHPADRGLLPGHGSFNIHGQVVFRAVLETNHSGIFISTPSVHWRTPGQGLWSVAENWSFGLLPSPALDVSIDPAQDAAVTGPAAATAVRSLAIGGGSGLAKLVLQPTGKITATKGVSVVALGTLSGQGTIGSSTTFSSGATVALKLGGTARGGYDYINFAGPVTFGGALQVATQPSFVPLLGTAFNLFDFTSHKGAFQTVSLPGLPTAGLIWDQSKLSSAGEIAVALVPALRGAFSGLITGDTAAHSGSYTATVQANGAVRLTGTYGGKAFSAKGAVDNDGKFTSTALDQAGDYLRGQLDFGNLAAGSLSGQVLDASAAPLAQTTAQQTPVFTKKAHSPREGIYTVALPPDTTQPVATFPQGTGYATISVSYSGRVRVVGVLGDGTPFSCGSMISAQGEQAVFVSLYKKGGVLSGRLVLEGPLATQGVTGTLRWIKPATVATKPYPGAFTASLAVEGSGFQKGASHPQVLDFPNGGVFTISGGNVPALPEESFMIDGAHRNAVVFNPPGPKLKFTGSTISGTFPSTIAAKPKSVSFRGVVLQKQNRARGLFKGDGENGSVLLEPQPAPQG